MSGPYKRNMSGGQRLLIFASHPRHRGSRTSSGRSRMALKNARSTSTVESAPGPEWMSATSSGFSSIWRVSAGVSTRSGQTTVTKTPLGLSRIAVASETARRPNLAAE
jgi:hypothetical protein